MAHLAAMNGQVNVISFLAYQAPESLSALDEVCMFCLSFYELVFQVGWTPAHYASAKDHANCLEVLGRLAPESLSVTESVRLFCFIF